jgi:uncharacterized membrane protein
MRQSMVLRRLTNAGICAAALSGRTAKEKFMANDEKLARALGWFSIGLGLAQLAAPRGVAKMIGVQDDEDNRNLLRGIGLRELTSGIGILTGDRPTGWLWSRVGGDAMDLSLLGKALTADDTQKGRAAAATAAVVGVTALDVLCSVQLSRGEGIENLRTVDVSKSVTINRPPEEVYRFWRDLENLPTFMRHLERVEVTGENRSHWVAKAPAGRKVEWDAEITEDRPNEFVSWRTLGGSDVNSSGSAEFLPIRDGAATELRVRMQYQPPAGMVGAIAAKMFGEEPQLQVNEDLLRFKQVMEVGEVIVAEGSPNGPYAPQRPGQPLPSST